MKDIGREYAFVGADFGGRFVSTAELHVMKCAKAMTFNDKNNWEKAMDEECQRMHKHNVF